MSGRSNKLLIFCALATLWPGCAAAQSNRLINIGITQTYFVSNDGTLVVGKTVTGGIPDHIQLWTAASGLIDIGNLPGAADIDGGVAANGNIIYGTSNIAGAAHGWIWTQAGGMVDIGGSDTAVNAASGDGTVLGGSSLSGPGYHAFRWTQGTGIVDLGTLGGTNSDSQNISYDGSAITGFSHITGDTETHAFRWTQATGMVDLGTLGGTESYGQMISRDNNVVFGISYTTGDLETHPFRWTQATGMVDLGTLGGGYAGLSSITDDGNTAVGYSSMPGDLFLGAVRWTQAGGMTYLGTLGGDGSEARTLSSDGNIVYGRSQTTGNAVYHGFRWTQQNGMEDVNTLLSDAGVDMTGIDVVDVFDTTPDGTYIVGEAFFGADLRGYLIYLGEETAGMTTGSAQIESTDDLATTIQGSSIGTRSASGLILGSVQPMRNVNNTSSGAMFGSAMGYASAEYTYDQVTILGGFGYGTQEYEGAELHAAPVFAAALRYSFGDLDTQQTPIPFIEGGGSITPFQDVTFSRSYANGAGTATGKGTTETIGSLWYARAGTAWNITDTDQVTAFGEYGQQYLNFNEYDERDDASNPFPAHIDGGTAKMDVVRAGGSWSHDINKTFSLTLSGAVARSLNVDSDLTATVSGVGTIEAEDKSHTWGEYGARLETKLTDEASLNFVVNGTKGGSGIGNNTHGGVSVSYKF